VTHTEVVTVEETMWDVRVSRQGFGDHDARLRTELAQAVEERLCADKELVRVMAWKANAGGLFAAEPGVRRFAVAYQVRVA
jgi:hypothetical protein